MATSWSGRQLDTWGVGEPPNPPVLDLMHVAIEIERCIHCRKKVARSIDGHQPTCVGCLHTWADLRDEPFDLEVWLMDARIDGRKLIKALREQGFILEKTNASGGWAAKDPQGRGIAHFHTSTLSDGRGSLNVMRDLKGIGFIDPQTWKRQQREEAKKQRDLEYAQQEQERIKQERERQAKVEEARTKIRDNVCPICKAEFKNKAGRDIHIGRSHKGNTPPTPVKTVQGSTVRVGTIPTTTGGTVPKVVVRNSPVRDTEQLVAQIKAGVEAATTLMSLIDTLRADRDRYKEKYEHLVEQLGKVVDTV